MLRTISKYTALSGLMMTAFTVCVHAYESDGKQAFSYTYIEGGYLNRRNNDVSPFAGAPLAANVDAGNGDGFFLRGSLNLIGGLYIYGAYEEDKSVYDLSAPIDGEVFSGEFDVRYRSRRAGLGFHTKITDNADVFVQAGLTYSSFLSTSQNVTRSSDGASLTVDLRESRTQYAANAEVGARVWAAGKLELAGSAIWREAQAIDSLSTDNVMLGNDFGGRAEARFHISQSFSLSAEYERTSMDRFLIAARVQF